AALRRPVAVERLQGGRARGSLRGLGGSAVLALGGGGLGVVRRDLRAAAVVGARVVGLRRANRAGPHVPGVDQLPLPARCRRSEEVVLVAGGVVAAVVVLADERLVAVVEPHDRLRRPVRREVVGCRGG